MPLFIYSLGLAFGLLAQTGAPSDVPTSHWAFKSVDGLYKAGILHGYPGSRFRGDAPVSNYEMAAALGSIVESEKQELGIDATALAAGLAGGVLELSTDLRAERPRQASGRN
jgi:hypothetical protein